MHFNFNILARFFLFACTVRLVACRRSKLYLDWNPKGNIWVITITTDRVLDDRTMHLDTTHTIRTQTLHRGNNDVQCTVHELSAGEDLPHGGRARWRQNIGVPKGCSIAQGDYKCKRVKSEATGGKKMYVCLFPRRGHKIDSDDLRDSEIWATAVRTDGVLEEEA